MATIQEIEDSLRKQIPEHLHWQVTGLALVLHDILSSEHLPTPAQIQFISDPVFREVLELLNEKRVRAGNAVITFEESSNVGDVSIRDVAGGNITTFNLQPSSNNNVLLPICPNCKAANSHEVLHCIKCGTKLVRECPDCKAVKSYLFSGICGQCGSFFEYAAYRQQLHYNLEILLANHKQLISQLRRIEEDALRRKDVIRRLNRSMNAKSKIIVACFAVSLALMAPSVLILISLSLTSLLAFINSETINSTPLNSMLSSIIEHPLFQFLELNYAIMVALIGIGLIPLVYLSIESVKELSNHDKYSTLSAQLTELQRDIKKRSTEMSVLNNKISDIQETISGIPHTKQSQ